MGRGSAPFPRAHVRPLMSVLTFLYFNNYDVKINVENNNVQHSSEKNLNSSYNHLLFICRFKLNFSIHLFLLWFHLKIRRNNVNCSGEVYCSNGRECDVPAKPGVN